MVVTELVFELYALKAKIKDVLLAGHMVAMVPWIIKRQTTTCQQWLGISMISLGKIKKVVAIEEREIYL